MPGNCSAAAAHEDLHAHYAEMRGSVAIGPEQLLPIDVPEGTQPCATFGLHASLPFLAERYAHGDAALLAKHDGSVKATVKELVARIDELGGVDAICGFSQGGALEYHHNVQSCDSRLFTPALFFFLALLIGFTGRLALMPHTRCVERLEVVTIVPHEDYNGDTFDNDIALIKLSAPSEYAAIDMLDQPDDDKPVVTGGGSLSNTRRELSESVLTASKHPPGTNVWTFYCVDLKFNI